MFKYLFFFIMLLVVSTFQLEFVVFNNAGKSRLTKRQSQVQEFPKITEFLVTTNVANRFAETSIVSKVENTDSYAKQTAFSVVLPERAYISGFWMEINGEKFTAYVKEKKEARKIFENVISTGQTAGHVAVSTRYANRFTINVNVEPLSKVIFNLNYEELLQRENSEYEIITNIQPGQIVKNLKVEITINESLPLLFVNTPYLRSGSNALLHPSTDLDPHAQVRIQNTSAKVVFKPDVSRQLEFACAGLGNEEFQGFAGQFIVKYDINRTNDGGETLYQDGFLLNFFAPQNFDPIPVHIVFVLDTSGSMDGLKIDQLKDSMLKILPQMNEEDAFSIVEYSSEVFVWDLIANSNNVLGSDDPDYIKYGNLANILKDTSIPLGYKATEENINKVKSLIASLNADGGTNAIGALEIGLLVIERTQLTFPNQFTPIMVFLTDGLPNVGVSSTEKIIKIITEINRATYSTPIYSLSFGSDADWNFLKNLSVLTEGKAQIISDSPDATYFLENFYTKISTLLLKNVTFNIPDSVQATRNNFLMFFNGSESVIAAKGVSSTKPVTLSAQSKNGTVNLESQLTIPRTKLEKVWAYLTVKELADQYQATGNKNLSKLALEIALNYTLVSDFTSLVVVKPDELGDTVDPIDASVGIFPQPPGDLPMCYNITDWIIDEYGTTEAFIDPTTIPPFEGIVLEAELPPFHETTETIITESTTTVITETTTETITTKIITCADSLNGCCSDGVTFSPGPNGDGCDPVPKSESCSLPFDSGTCNNLTTKWFYSTVKNKCISFYYSGCGGNDNRFATKEICEKTCVYVNTADKCNLPISMGNCNKKVLKWFYNKTSSDCVKYMYGGCDGNSNMFNSKQACLRECNPLKLQKTIEDLCFLPKDKGRPGCRRFEINYYFDYLAGKCLKFWFNGCGGNDNRFNNKEVCEKMCIKTKNKAICAANPDSGHCARYYSLFYYDQKTSSCKSFIYSGCGGNRNKFLTKKECEDFCT